MSEEKTYQMRITLSEREHSFLLEKQKKRLQCGLPFLNLENLVKLLMLEGLFQSHFFEQRQERRQ